MKVGDIYKARVYSKEILVEIMNKNGDEIVEVCSISGRNQYFNNKDNCIKQFELIEKVKL